VTKAQVIEAAVRIGNKRKLSIVAVRFEIDDFAIFVCLDSFFGEARADL
jgi:hypothetical protein